MGEIIEFVFYICFYIIQFIVFNPIMLILIFIYSVMYISDQSDEYIC